MSRYFATLNRMKSGRENSSSTLVPDRESGPNRGLSTPNENSTLGRAQVFPELPLALRRSAEVELLNTLRAESQTQVRPKIVLSGASGKERIDPILKRLQKQSRDEGIRLTVINLTVDQGRRLLRQIPAPRESTLIGEISPSSHIGAEVSNPTFDLSSMQDDQQMLNWLNSKRDIADLVIVRAPAVSSSSDSLLLAKLCDGLAIVVEPRLTSRESLRLATERANSSGCHLMGLVIVGRRDPLPRWFERLLENLHI